MGSQERFHRYQGRNFESFVIRCLWMFMLLIAETFATEFIPVSRCPDVSPDTSLEQASGFVCSDVKDQLHCILEDDNYKLGLVCTRWAWIPKNVCPIFSVNQNGMKYSPCSGNYTLCPIMVSEYKSFEAYKYPGCFIGKDMLTTTKETTQPTTTKETTQATTTKETTQPTTTKIKSESPDLPAYVYVLITICVVSVILNIILIVIFRKPITRWLKKHMPDTDSGSVGKCDVNKQVEENEGAETPLIRIENCPTNEAPSERQNTSSESTIVDIGSDDEEDPNGSVSKKETSDKELKNDSEHQNSIAQPESVLFGKLNVNQREEENKGADRPLIGEHMADTDSGSVVKFDVDKQVEENEGADSPLIGKENDEPESILKTYYDVNGAKKPSTKIRVDNTDDTQHDTGHTF